MHYYPALDGKLKMDWLYKTVGDYENKSLLGNECIHNNKQFVCCTQQQKIRWEVYVLVIIHVYNSTM